MITWLSCEKSLISMGAEKSFWCACCRKFANFWVDVGCFKRPIDMSFFANLIFPMWNSCIELFLYTTDQIKFAKKTTRWIFSHNWQFWNSCLHYCLGNTDIYSFLRYTYSVSPKLSGTEAFAPPTRIPPHIQKDTRWSNYVKECVSFAQMNEISHISMRQDNGIIQAKCKFGPTFERGGWSTSISGRCGGGGAMTKTYPGKAPVGHFRQWVRSLETQTQPNLSHSQLQEWRDLRCPQTWSFKQAQRTTSLSRSRAAASRAATWEPENRDGVGRN